MGHNLLTMTTMTGLRAIDGSGEEHAYSNGTQFTENDSTMTGLRFGVQAMDEVEKNTHTAMGHN